VRRPAGAAWVYVETKPEISCERWSERSTNETPPGYLSFSPSEKYFMAREGNNQRYTRLRETLFIGSPAL